MRLMTIHRWIIEICITLILEYFSFHLPAPIAIVFNAAHDVLLRQWNTDIVLGFVQEFDLRYSTESLEKKLLLNT